MARRNGPKLKTARRSTTVAAFMAVLITGVLGVAEFAGLSPDKSFTVMEALALFGGSLILLLEIFVEGSRTGMKKREWSATDLLGAIVALGTLILGLGGLIGELVAMPFIALPNWLQGLVIMLLPLLLLWELLTE